MNPSYAPHSGGLCKSAVKSVKGDTELMWIFELCVLYPMNLTISSV